MSLTASLAKGIAKAAKWLSLTLPENTQDLVTTTSAHDGQDGNRTKRLNTTEADAAIEAEVLVIVEEEDDDAELGGEEANKPWASISTLHQMSGALDPSDPALRNSPALSPTLDWLPPPRYGGASSHSALSELSAADIVRILETPLAPHPPSRPYDLGRGGRNAS